MNPASPAPAPAPAPSKDKGGKEDPSPSSSSSSSSPKPAADTLPPVPFSRLFRYATFADQVLLAVSIICACATGVSMPLFSLFFGDLLNAINAADRQAQVNRVCTQIGGLALAAGIAGYAGVSLAQYSAVRQVSRLRSAYLSALLRQDPGWYDTNRPSEATSRMAADTVTIASGIGEKLITAFTSFATFFAGFVLGFVRGWKMALVMLGFLPVIAIVGGILNKYIASRETAGADAYGKAGAIATEVLSSIRTVASFNSEAAEVRRYDKELVVIQAANKKKALLTGLSIGVLLACIFFVYAVGLYFGGRLVVWSREDNAWCASPAAFTSSECFTGGNVMQVLFGLLIGAASLGQAGPSLASIAAARGAAASMFQIIDRVPTIDVDNAGGLAPPLDQVKGRVEFKNVTFAYPSRPDQVVLKDFSLVIEPGTTVALVGPSGSGKSTLVALLQRWYDPASGQVLLDGVDVKEYNVQWLRSLQSLVNQEPQLFATTLRENIALGKPGLVAPTEEDVVAAAKAANAHGFITALKDGYDTKVTTAQLSGGQKQRVAIARALIRRAPILLLDEATSALDSTAERHIQKDIDRLLAGGTGVRQTAIVIAHRLSTVTRSDKIVVLDSGSIVESGSHEELMATPGSLYRRLRELQRVGGGNDIDEVEEEAAEDAAKAATAAAAAAEVAAAKAPVSAPAPAAAPAAAAPTAAAAAAKPKDGARSEEEALADDEVYSHPPVPLSRMLSYIRAEWGWLAFGVFSSASQGLIFPLFSIFISRFIDVYYEPDNTILLNKTLQYLGYLVLIGVGAFLFSLTATYSWGVSSEALLRRVRREAFRGLVRTEVGWHDLPSHSVGRTTSRLASEAELLKQTMGMNWNMNVQNIVGLITGFTIAFVASWRMTLVILSIGPLIAAGGALQASFFLDANKEATAAFAECGEVATEAVTTSRVVTAFGLQGSVRSRFAATLVRPTAAAGRAALSAGIGVGIGNAVMIGVYGVAFYVGTLFIEQGLLTFQELMQSFFAVVFAAIGMGNSAAMGADAIKADRAKRALFYYIDRVSPIDPLAETGGVPGVGPTPPLRGKLELENVTFSYPARPDQVVLKNLTLTIEPGTTVAIVGPSGSGKSTVVQLLERFYDPASGTVKLDGVPLPKLNVHALRAAYGWVPQEAPLFAESVAYNIAYGCVADADKPVAGLGVAPDAGEGATGHPDFTVSPAVLRAAEAASARDFVEGFGHGFATYVGDRGNQLSGGQKQRVAIARAILRDPKILLFDEATSALDSRSEAQVQAAIDDLLTKSKAAGEAERRTTILIAHRLSTIRKADLIYVLDKGVLVESGTHDELVGKHGGVYALMVAAQDHGLARRGSGAAPPAN
jgi:ATP-binding cassette, subfamily B (MDR/TAP), member 1